MQAVCAAVPLELLQFHGSETPEYCRAFGRPYLKAIAMGDGGDVALRVRDYPDAAALLFDAHATGGQGGSGRTFDWSRIPRDLARPVVLAGGAGTRFWPASRRARPKPFVPLVGEETLIEATLARMRRLAPAKRIAVLASADQAGLVRRSLRRHRGMHALFEPEARNTAAAIAWAAAWVASRLLPSLAMRS